MNYTMGSLFDGSGGFPLAGSLCGITPKWASEVEPYPIAVTRSRFPDMKHLGDISKINGAEIEPVDIITFGSPCQDLSLAGKRAGLKHEANGDEETTRSGLFMEAVRIIKEMRDATNGKYPRFALWENVPGAFSSNKGKDFRVVCEEIIKIVEPSAVMPEVPKKGWPYADSYIGDGWSLAYRVFDAQYWGVPQRRRRIHLVTDFRGECAREILFEREGVRGHFETGRTPWKAVAGDAERSSGTDDCEGECVAYSFDSLASNSMKSKNPHSGCRRVEIGKTLDTTDPNTSKNQGGIAIVCIKECLPFDTTQVTSPQNGCNPKWGDPCHPLAAQGHPPTVICKCYDARGNGEVAATLDASYYKGCGMRQRIEREVVVQPIMDSSQIFAVENHPADSRVNIVESGTVQTLTSRMRTGGGNVPMVMEPKPVYCLQGNGIDRADTAGCNGKGWKDGTCYTLNAIDRRAVTYGIGNGQANQSFSEEMVGALNCMHDQQAVGYAMQAIGEYADKDIGSSLKQRDYKDATDLVVEAHQPRYIVRRLTPTECARLQGFADRWGDIDRKDSFTPEEYAFWLDVRNTHAAINGKQVKDYTEKQMLTWYNKLHTDSAEYKMWGNGIALPPALYCMQGILDALNKEAKREDFTWETIEAMWS